MKDVAARAGVGLSTVSRVVAGGDGVSREKVRAVERAIRDLNFVRNDFARTLRTGSSDTVGMVVTNIADPFFASLVGAVEERAREHNQMVLVVSSGDDEVGAVKAIQRLLRRSLGGLIVVAPERADLDFLNEAVSGGVPVVYVDQPPPFASDLVIVDNEGGIASAVAHLVAGGHRRIACLAHEAGAFTSQRRQEGYWRGLREQDLPADPELLEVIPDRRSAARAALTRLSRLDDPPTAVITTNNRTTRAVLPVAAEIVPQWAVIGFDDFDFAELTTPPTTTIAQDPWASGHAAADLLFERIAGTRGPWRRIVLGTHLIARGSGERPPGARDQDHI